MALPRNLVEGHWRFRRDRHAPDRGRYEQLAALGQAPTAMVIACCDARVDVSAIFDAEAGELFIVRNVANLVPPYEPEGRYHGTSAAVEYALILALVGAGIAGAAIILGGAIATAINQAATCITTDGKTCL